MRSRREIVRSSAIALMGKALNGAFDQPERILNEREGEASECPFCELVLKLCRRSPWTVCGRVRKSGTLLAGYEAVISRLEDESFGLCVRCGRSIDAALLGKDPLAELCSTCSGKGTKRDYPSRKNRRRRVP